MSIIKKLFSKANNNIKDYFLYKGCLTLLEGNDKIKILQQLYFNPTTLNESLTCIINFDDSIQFITSKVNEVINESGIRRIIFDKVTIPLNKYKKATTFYIIYNKFYILRDFKKESILPDSFLNVNEINIKYSITL